MQGVQSVLRLARVLVLMATPVEGFSTAPADPNHHLVVLVHVQKDV